MRELLKYIVAFALLCPLSIGVVNYVSTACPLWLAFCLAIIADCLAGYALFAGMFRGGDQGQAKPAQQSFALLPTAKPARNVAGNDKRAKPAKSALPAQSKEQALQSSTIAEARKSAKKRDVKPEQSDDLIVRLASLPALAGIAHADIAAVVEEHNRGTMPSRIYLALHWGSKKHTTIVKPVIEALTSMTA